MTMLANTYNWLRCNARMENLMQPQCPAVSPGGFNNPDLPDLVLKLAVGQGWTEVNGKHYCPAHSQIEAPVEAKPARARRLKPVPPEPETPQYNGEDHQ